MGMAMNVNYHNPIIAFMKNWIQHYNHDRYWRYRQFVLSPRGGKISLIIKLVKLMYIKRCDAFNNASLGTDLGRGALFKSVPKFPRGINGIIISPDAEIGKNCIIFHQVTIGNDYRDTKNVPVIGDNVVIYPGAKITGKIKIGNNVKIGANAVVVDDIPDNATVVAPKARMIIKI